MFKDLSMRIFLGHLVAYVVVTALCAAVNLYLTPDTLWFPWVLIGWGVAVATHAFALLLRKTRRRERIFIDRKARAFAVHLFAYVAVVLVLLSRQRRGDAEGLVVLLGGARLGRGRRWRKGCACSSGGRKRAPARPRRQRCTESPLPSRSKRRPQPPVAKAKPPRKRAPRTPKPKA